MLTFIMEVPDIAFNSKILEKGAQIVKDTNREGYP